MTLLLGPPGSGKTSLLLALAGTLPSDLKVLASFLHGPVKDAYLNRLWEYCTNMMIYTVTKGNRKYNLQWAYNGRV